MSVTPYGRMFRAVRYRKWTDVRESSSQTLGLMRTRVRGTAWWAFERVFGLDVDYRSIPVILNNRDRLSSLQQMIGWLERAEMTNIHILDNASTYPPLLDYYQQCPHEVIQLGRNVGYTALWLTDVFGRFKNGYYVYSDPDVLPSEECPLDAVAFFLKVLRERPSVAKVGFGLRIDDLPEHFALRDRVIRWERRWWRDPVGQHLYRATIDTTFALYRPGAEGGWWCPALRTGQPYMARHLPWYADSDHPTEEEIYYRNHAEAPSHWTHLSAVHSRG